MEEAGRAIEELLNYLKAEGCVEYDKIGFIIEEDKKVGITDFLLTLKLIEQNGDQIMITESGLEFLGL